MSEMFIKRLKSLAWKFGNAVVLFALTWLTDNVSSLELDPFVMGFISLGLGYITSEITKWWAIKQASLGKTFFGRVL